MDQTSETEKAYQREKYEEIVDILLSAGYFRARINTLSEFDKVVGGLCWCITSSGEDVDVDILFQENSTIGQRIALSEAIVKALRKMNCPSQLQPHQIQGGVGGSDFPAIHPVIVWLVKKFFERREAREEELRSFSVLQFSKNYQLPTETASFDVSPVLSKILSKSKAIRSFRRKISPKESEETRVQSCLLEYGDSFFRSTTQGQQFEKSGSTSIVGGSNNMSSVPMTSNSVARGSDSHQAIPMSPNGITPASLENMMRRLNVSEGIDVSISSIGGINLGSSSEMSMFEKKLAQAAKEAHREEQIFAEQASKQEAELMGQMSEVAEDGGAISGSNLGAIVGLRSGEIGQAAAAYQAEIEESKKVIDNSLATGILGQVAAQKRQKAQFMKQLEELDSKLIEVLAQQESLQEKLEILEDERSSAVDYQDQLAAQLRKIDDLEIVSKQQSDLATLKRLVFLNESLRLQEAEFKASCKAQLQEFMSRLQGLEEMEDAQNEENQKLMAIEDMHSKVMGKYNSLRQILAETNLEVANTSRIIDDVPTRTELIQYERRFVELYQQVEWKLEETRKYYDMYNTLDTTLSHIQKEAKLLNSIRDTFGEAMRTIQGRTEFLKQFEQIVRGVEDMQKKQAQILSQRNDSVDELKNRHQVLVDEQRKYFKTVKDFQEECNKNEWLLTKLEQLSRG